MTEPVLRQEIESVPSRDELVCALKRHLDGIKPSKILFVVGRHTTEQEIRHWASGFSYSRFTGFSPNPKMDEVKAGVKVFEEEGCDVLVAVGGGSAIDVAKSIKWELINGSIDQNSPYTDSLRLIAVPTTAGTGAESTPFAVVYVDGVKNSLDAPFLLPDVALLCGELTLSVPAYHRNAAFMDALCQAMESTWARTATSESQALAINALEELLTHGCQYVQPLSGDKLLGNDPHLDLEARLEAAQGTLQGANLAGRAIALTRTTAPHAMSYGMTAALGIAHGHSVALCWIAVCEAHVRRAYETSDFLRLRNALEAVSKAFDLDGPHDLPLVVASIVRLLDLERPGISHKQAARLAEGVNAQRLCNNPVHFSSPEISDLYLAASHSEPARVDVPKTYKGRYSRLEEAEGDLETLGKWALTHKKRWGKAKQIQDLAMRTLSDIDTACKKLGIEYFLFEGALLGAIRHQGPIPWDDDIDIAFLREDYDRFVKEAPELLGDEYVVDTYETNPKHWTISGKVIKKAQTDYIHLRAEGLALANGVFVDLFALDRVLKEKSLRNIIRGRYISVLRSLLFHRTGYQVVPSKKHGFIKKTLSRFTPVPWLHEWIDYAQRLNKNTHFEYVANFGSLYKIERETFSTSDLFPTKSASYGELNVPIPLKSTKILEKIYGDFSILPPYQKREGKHSFVLRAEYEQHMASLITQKPWYW